MNVDLRGRRGVRIGQDQTDNAIHAEIAKGADGHLPAFGPEGLDRRARRLGQKPRMADESADDLADRLLQVMGVAPPVKEGEV